MSAQHNVLPMMKACTKCEETKTVSEFYFRDGKPKARCMECTKEDNRKAKGNHKLDKNLARERYKRWREGLLSDDERHKNYKSKKAEWNKSDVYYDSYFKRKFGITLDIFNRMLSDQNGFCANLGCNREISLHRTKDKTKAVVDHCHRTGNVRGLMCVRCNSLLGHIEKHPLLVPGLENYLTKNRIG